MQVEIKGYIVKTDDSCPKCEGDGEYFDEPDVSEFEPFGTLKDCPCGKVLYEIPDEEYEELEDDDHDSPNTLDGRVI